MLAVSVDKSKPVKTLVTLFPCQPAQAAQMMWGPFLPQAKAISNQLLMGLIGR